MDGLTFTNLAAELADSPLRLLMLVNHAVGLIYNLATDNKKINISFYNSISTQSQDLINNFKAGKLQAPKVQQLEQISYLNFLEFLIGFFELFSTFNLVYGLFLLVKEPSSYGTTLALYTTVQLVIAAVSGVSFLTISIMLFLLARDIDSLVNGGGSAYSYIMKKYVSVILNLLFMDTVPAVGNYLYLKMLN